jgi:AraC-like DNA-binding protein
MRIGKLKNSTKKEWLWTWMLVCVVGSLAFSASAPAQIRIEIVNVPPGTPATDTLYLSASFNAWNPNDARYRFQKTDNQKYVLELPDSTPAFDYKITRGSWQLVEGNVHGDVRPNRMFRPDKDGKHLSLAIESWEDLFHYTFVLDKIPENTPHDASIYIAGNFNDWNPAYPVHKLTKNKQGRYEITLFSKLEKLEYKFTRGTWESVEGRENGRALPNRILYRNQEPGHIIKTEVATWEDLSYHVFLYDVLLLFSAFQGILLIFAIMTVQDHNRDANRLLVLLIGITSLSLLCRILPTYREIFQAFPKLILLPELVLFLYAPIFYFYIQKLLTHEKISWHKWYHALPFLVLLLVYLPYFFMDKQKFIDKIVSRELSGIFEAVGGVALITNSYYWFVCYKIVKAYKNQYARSQSFEQNLHYLTTMLLITGLCLVVWVFMCVSVILDKVLEMDTVALVEKSTDGIWLVFATITYFMGYYAINQPQIFRLHQNIDFFKPTELVAEPESGVNRLPVGALAESDSPTTDDPDINLQPLMEKLESYMLAHKPYTDPKLSIHDLATGMQLSHHLLSRVINEGFHKNFFDFINSYRVEEFKRLIQIPQYHHFTLLSIAFEVGFNSKTAFNRAFKKLTNYTPSEYFYEIRGKA